MISDFSPTFSIGLVFFRPEWSSRGLEMSFFGLAGKRFAPSDFDIAQTSALSPIFLGLTLEH